MFSISFVKKALWVKEVLGLWDNLSYFPNFPLFILSLIIAGFPHQKGSKDEVLHG